MENNRRKCGFRDCQNQIEKQDGDAWLTLTRCNSCLVKREKAVKGVKGDIDYKKEVIQKIQKFLAKNISAELHQELNLAFQKCCELEKILPELEKLAGECERESQACRGKFVREKGGQRFNIYEYCLCDSCYKEVSKRERKIRDDYQSRGLNKLNILNVEYTEEEFEKHHKEIKEHLEKKLKEERNNLKNKSSKVIQESERDWLAILLTTIRKKSKIGKKNKPIQAGEWQTGYAADCRSVPGGE
ncbi:11251_t:CDS:2 [Entrophospora sp. SA101]|nr:11251_t:CDS:2 [Entrophospora sp. SA101]